MKATSFLFVVFAASMLAGCPEEKAKPAAEPEKPAAAAPSAAAPAPAKADEKKEEGGW